MDRLGWRRGQAARRSERGRAAAAAADRSCCGAFHCRGDRGGGCSPAPRLDGGARLPAELCIVVAELVSQSSGWLKASAFMNVPPKFVTLLVSQASGWLKALA